MTGALIGYFKPAALPAKRCGFYFTEISWDITGKPKDGDL